MKDYWGRIRGVRSPFADYGSCLASKMREVSNLLAGLFEAWYDAARCSDLRS
jgi:hypothetical protein